MYSFHVIAIPDKKNHGADALSRIPNTDAEYVTTSVNEIETALEAVIDQVDTSYIIHRSIKKAANNDSNYEELTKIIESGFTNTKEETPATLRHFWE